jgi:hypothetical protein
MQRVLGTSVWEEERREREKETEKLRVCVSLLLKTQKTQLPSHRTNRVQAQSDKKESGRITGLHFRIGRQPCQLPFLLRACTASPVSCFESRRQTSRRRYVNGGEGRQRTAKQVNLHLQASESIKSAVQNALGIPRYGTRHALQEVCLIVGSTRR